MSPLSRADMTRICLVAREAYDAWPGRDEWEQNQREGVNAFDAWRHAQQRQAVGHNSLKQCTTADYRPLLAHFHRLREQHAIESQTPALNLSQ